MTGESREFGPRTQFYVVFVWILLCLVRGNSGISLQKPTIGHFNTSDLFSMDDFTSLIFQGCGNWLLSLLT